MELNDLINESKKDLQYDTINLQNSITDIPKLVSKWIDYRVFESRVLNRHKRDMEVLINKKFLYYTGKAEPIEYKEKPFGLKILKTDVPSFIESDPDIQRNKKLIDLQNEKIYVIDETYKELKSRNFQIRDLIKWKEYLDGK